MPTWRLIALRNAAFSTAPRDERLLEDRPAAIERAAASSRENPTLAPTHVRYALGVLVLVNVVNYADRSIIGVLIEPMKRDLALSDTQIGVVTGLAFALFYAIAGIFLAHLADRSSRTRLIAISLVAWSAMTALTGAVQNFWHLLVARMGVGVGEASAIPASAALIADYHRAEQRSFAFGLFVAGAMVGIMIGSWIGGGVAHSYGWRWAFLVAGLPGLPLAYVVFRTLREPSRGASDGIVASAHVPFVTAVRLIVSSRTLMLMIFGYAFVVFMLFGVITWLPALLVRHHGMGLAAVGLWFGAAVGLGTAAGALIGGQVTNRLAARDLAWMTRLPIALLLLMWPLYELAIFAPTAHGALAMFALVAAVGGAAYGPLGAAVQTVLPPAIRATGHSLNGFVSSVVGVGGGPLLVGIVSDRYQTTLGEGPALQRGLAIAVCAALIGVLLVWLGHRKFVRGLAKREWD